MGEITITPPIRNPANDERDRRFQEQTGKPYREWKKSLGGKAIRKLRKRAKQAEQQQKVLDNFTGVHASSDVKVPSIFNKDRPADRLEKESQDGN